MTYAHFPTLGASCIIFRVWRLLHVFPRLAPVDRFRFTGSRLVVYGLCAGVSYFLLASGGHRTFWANCSFFGSGKAIAFLWRVLLKNSSLKGKKSDLFKSLVAVYESSVCLAWYSEAQPIGGKTMRQNYNGQFKINQFWNNYLIAFRLKR